MINGSGAEPRKPKRKTVSALDALPLTINVNLTRDAAGKWACSLFTNRKTQKWSGQGQTADEAASEALQSFEGSAEVSQIEKALTKTDGDKAAAARLLGISRKTLYRKLQRHAQH